MVKKRIRYILIGLALVALGVLIALDVLGVMNINFFFEGWWTLLIIIPCFIGLFTDMDKTVSVVGIVVGSLILLVKQDVVDGSIIWRLIFPVVLVIIGLSFLIQGIFDKNAKEIRRRLDQRGSADKVNHHAAAFNTLKVDYAGMSFSNCEANASFGSVTVDLRAARIEPDPVVTASGVFGKVTILVPAGVGVKVSSTSLFGAVSDHRLNKAQAPNAPTIFVKGTGVFGGVEIR